MKTTRVLLSVAVMLICCTGCVSVAGYQRMYLEDPEMASAERKIEGFEQEAQSYREGASGANGGKSGGGCGCN